MPSNIPTVSLVDGRPVVSSVAVAEHFEKRHDRVLESIRNIMSNLPQRHLPNFREVSYRVKRVNGGVAEYPCYNLTRDGFTLLAMGFTGKKALRWKLKYIEAFNAMEQKLSTRPALDASRSTLTPEQREELMRVVSELAGGLPDELRRIQAVRSIWGQFRERYRLENLLDLPQGKFEEAVRFVKGLPLAGAEPKGLERSRVLPPQVPDPLETQRMILEARMTAMSEVTAKLVAQAHEAVAVGAWEARQSASIRERERLGPLFDAAGSQVRTLGDGLRDQAKALHRAVETALGLARLSRIRTSA